MLSLRLPGVQTGYTRGSSCACLLLFILRGIYSNFTNSNFNKTFESNRHIEFHQLWFQLNPCAVEQCLVRGVRLEGFATTRKALFWTCSWWSYNDILIQVVWGIIVLSPFRLFAVSRGRFALGSRGSSRAGWPSRIWTQQFTVPQKGYDKRGSNRQIAKKPLLSHLKVNFLWNPFQRTPSVGRRYMSHSSHM